LSQKGSYHYFNFVEILNMRKLLSKIGCGYNGCTNTPTYKSKEVLVEDVKHIEFTEIK